jgi:hypothetical protein
MQGVQEVLEEEELPQWNQKMESPPPLLLLPLLQNSEVAGFEPAGSKTR